MQRLQSLYLILILALLTSCGTIQQLGFTAPQTTEDKIMAGHSSVGAAYQTIANLAKRRAITREQGQRLIGRADDAKTIIETADDFLASGKETEAANMIEFATQILVALEKELKDKESTPNPLPGGTL